MKQYGHNQQRIFRILMGMLLLIAFTHTEKIQAAALPDANGPVRIFMPVQAGIASSNTQPTPTPVVSTPNPAYQEDLVITHVEVTQGIQDRDNGVPLVAGRKTMLRVYAVNNCVTSCEHKGLPEVTIALAPSDSHTPLVVEPLLYKAAIGALSLPEIVSSSVNIPLPDAWTNGTYDLTITVDAENQVAEAREDNNQVVQHLNFAAVPNLRVMIVPVEYTSTQTNINYAAPTVDSVSAFIQNIYPVNTVEVTWHAPYAYRANLEEVSAFSDLLSLMAQLKAADNAPEDLVYYALVGTRSDGNSWFQGGVVGIGYIGLRVAVGLDYWSAGATAAHEIGHNLGRYHSPCGGASNIDPAYPYQDGSIGQFGYNLTTGAIYTPESAKDLMSYCNPKWISDYTYRKLYQALMAQVEVTSASAASEPGQVLQVRARVTSASAEFLPVYVGMGQPSSMPAHSDYRLQLADAQGNLLSDTPAPVYAIDADDAGLFYEMNARIAFKDGAATMRLLRGDQLLAETALPESNGMARTTANGAAQTVTVTPLSNDRLSLRWNTTVPVMIRYSVNGGQSWTTLAVDVSGGQWTTQQAVLPQMGGIFQIVPSFGG